MNFFSFRSGIVSHPRRLATLLTVLTALPYAGVARAELLVLQPGGSGKGPGIVQRYDETTGAPLGAFGRPNEGMRGMCADADGRVLVGANTLGQGDIYRFDRTGIFLGSAGSEAAADYMAMTVAPDGTFFGVVLDSTAIPARYRIDRARRGEAPVPFIAPDRAGLGAPRALAIGPDGNLYVADARRGILRYAATTGAFIDAFVPPGRGGQQEPVRLAFGTDGRLYVASAADHAVRRFDGATGAFVDVFVAPGAGGLRQPGGLAFAPDGQLYVSSRDTHQVLRYDGATGAFRGALPTDPTLRAPTWLVFTSPQGVASALGMALR